jgi:hypothetical protein
MASLVSYKENEALGIPPMPMGPYSQCFIFFITYERAFSVQIYFVCFVFVSNLKLIKRLVRGILI